ncbi:MATE family efflux transporter [Vallitalea okinawensis]|uniref:MATE family efflux transporter n=1 Tax=Vallitalea okinawensis TaxID=2078660 RepID=UPI000CFD0F2C|nr:MATE family efflux transporter [Vallitalea okinawensis]
MTIKGHKNLIKEVLQMGLPLVLNTLTATIITLVDQAMVGHISIEAFGAVGLIGAVINSITGVLGMSAVAFNIQGAKLKGEKDEQGLNHLFWVSITISLLCGLTSFGICFIFGESIIEVLFGISETLLIKATSYLSIFSLSIGLNMLIFTFSAFLKIMNRTKYIFLGNLVASLCNLILDYILIFGKFGLEPLGVRGAGIASIVSISINLLIMIPAIKRTGIIQNACSSIKVFLVYLKSLFHIAPALMAQELMEYTFFTIVLNRILASNGVVALSTYSLLFNVFSLQLMPMYAFGSVAMTKVSEHRKDITLVKVIPKICLAISISIGLILGMLIVWQQNLILQLFTDDSSLVENASDYLILACSVYGLTNLQHIYQAGLQGIGDEKWVFIGTTVSSLLTIVVIRLLSCFPSEVLTSVYLGLMFNQILLLIIMKKRFYRHVNGMMSRMMTI